MKGLRLGRLTWPEAEQALQQFQVVLLPVGAGAKEHGHHLPLNTDWLLAEYLTNRVIEQFSALVLPTLSYGYYPAFTEYPGSTHVARETFTATVVDIIRSVHRHGANRVYVLNTGISTNWGLEPARQSLHADRIVMEYTDLRIQIDQVAASVRQQPAGSHADEIETSMMLYIHPEVVHMERARRDISSTEQNGPLTRDANSVRGVYSPTGAWGDPTLATAEKGRVIVDALVTHLVEFLERFASDEYEADPPREEYL
ncbi:MAG: creatininase family protein [Pirellulales bacterium]